MPTYHGVTAKSYFERIAAEGQIQKEVLGILSGGSVDQDFYTAMFPITTNAGVATDVETNVNVYTRVPTGLTWVTLSNASETDFAITGATGLVKIKAAKNQPGDAGKIVSIDYWTKAEVGMGQGDAITTGREVKDIYKLGSADVQELVAGKKQPVTVKIKNYYVNRDLAGKLLGESDFYKKLAALSHYLYPNGVTTGQPRIKVANIVAEGHGITASVDDAIVEDLSLKGITLTIDLVP